jgi:hypothetical protein
MGLDVVLIPDDVQDCDVMGYAASQTGGKYLTSLNLQGFKQIEPIFSVWEEPFVGFFHDTRLKSRQVVQLLNHARQLEAQLKGRGNLGFTPYRDFIAILEQATRRDQGLLFISD